MKMYRFLFGGQYHDFRPPRVDKSYIFKDIYRPERRPIETNLVEVDLSMVKDILEYDLGVIVPEQPINDEYVKTVTEAVVKSIFRLKNY